MMRQIFNDGNGTMPEDCCEINSRDYEALFVDAVCDKVVSTMRFNNWTERAMIKNILVSAMEDEMKNLLKQYLHSQLEILSRSVIQALGVNKELKPNYNYATHAKFETILEEFRKEHKPKSIVTEDEDDSRC